MAEAPSIGAIIVAAGSSQRMAGTDKLWIDLGGRPLLARTVQAIAGTPGLVALVVVAGAETRTRIEALADESPWSLITRLVPGGATRQDSVYYGLQALARCSLVLIHDGARPLVDLATLERGIALAQERGSAVATVAATDTIKVVDADGRVLATPERSTLSAAQTPQIFAWETVHHAYTVVGARRSSCTDDAGVLELAGLPVYTYPGERTNLKVSTPADIVVVRALWAARQDP